MGWPARGQNFIADIQMFLYCARYDQSSRNPQLFTSFECLYMILIVIYLTIFVLDIVSVLSAYGLGSVSYLQ